MRVPAGLLSAVLLTGLVAACGPNNGGGTPDGGSGGKTGPTVRHYTFRALAGVSMGAIGTSAVGPEHADRFDDFGALGGPFDASYMLHFLQTQELGGFCTYQDYLKLLQDHPGDTSILNDKATIEACAIHPDTTQPFEHPSSFNDWWFDDNGGTFDRSAYIDLFEDLSLALGNPAYDNPASPFYPPGVDESWTCDNPIVIKGTDHGGTHPIYNAEYNPDGRFDVITFCDGEEPITVCQKTGQPVDFCSSQTPDAYCGTDGPAVTPSKSTLKSKWPDTYYSQKGAYDPCQPHHQRVRIALAVDYDGDGKRDYGEPVVVNAAERFEDTGVDGCYDAQEDGSGGCVAAGASGPYDPKTDPDPNGDDYSWQTNPTGTEHDFKWEKGETYADDGLDGVPNTGDFGEGNHKYDMSANEKNFYAHDARTAIQSWSDATANRVGFYLDGGIRDIFNFGVNASQVYGALSARRPKASSWYQDFVSLPSLSGGWNGTYDWQSLDLSKVPGRSLLLYGTVGATEQQWRNGDGAHVGTGTEVINRFNTFFDWLSNRWPDGDYTPVSKWNFDTLSKTVSYQSAALGSKRDFFIALPPGYDDPANGDLTYPVLYFLHGYGQDPQGMGALNLVIDGYEADGLLQKMIVVYVDGRCCMVDDAGNRDCDEPPGKTFGSQWHRECHAGSFYVNRTGTGAGDQTPYADSLFELMDYVDAHYRAKPAADVTLK